MPARDAADACHGCTCRATCPGGPALGSFSVLPFTVYGKKQPKVTHNSKIAALRETLCPGAKVDPGRFALLGTELPTRKVTSKGYAEIWDRFPYEAVNTLEEIEPSARRVFGWADPLTMVIERDLQDAQAAICKTLGAINIRRRRLAPSLEDLLEKYTPLVKLTDEEKDLLARRTRSVGLLV